MRLWEKLRKARYAKQMSLSELAVYAKCSKTYVHELESGKAENPSPDKLTRIADALDVTLEFLINENCSDDRSMEGLEAFYKERAARDQAERNKKRAELTDIIKNLASERKYSRHEIAEKAGTTIHILDKIIKNKKNNINLTYNCGQTYKIINWQKEHQNIVNLIRSGKTRDQLARHLGVAYTTLCNYIINHCPSDLRVNFYWSDEELDSLKKLYNAGDYRHEIVKESDRTFWSIRNAVRKYVNTDKKLTPLNPVSGEDSYFSKFENAVADRIRANFLTGGYNSIAHAASVHGVCFQTMHNLLNYKTYIRHLNIDIEKIIELRNEMKEFIKKNR